MARFPLGGLFLIVCLLGAPARADHFTVNLEVKGTGKPQQATADVAALGARPKPRAMLEARVGERLTVKWALTNTDAKRKAKNVLVHFFVVKADKAGQQVIPKLDKDVAVETALAMDFDPKDKNEGELTFAVEKAGVYLLRLETIGAAVGSDGHEHFAALDLIVK